MNTTQPTPDRRSMRTYKLLPAFAGIFAAVLVLTNVLNTKIFSVLGFNFPAGILTFPISFLIADALTEVYGYAITRRVIWIGFATLVFMALVLQAVIDLPPAAFWKYQDAFAALFTQIPRIVLASILAYAVGEFCNSYVLARSKVRTDGHGMPLRFVSSTVVGQAADTVVFMTIAFLGVFPAGTMLTLFLSSWLLKVVWEVVALPLSLPLVRAVKRIESEDYFDRTTKFNPFRLGE